MAGSLGMPLGPVSIRPGQHYLGIAHSTALPYSEAEARQLGRIIPLLPARFRRAVECAVMVSLAGRMGEGWAGPAPTTGYIGDEDETAARLLVGRLVLTPGEIADLEAADVPQKTDEERAYMLAGLLAEDRYAGSYLNFLRTCTERYVSHPDFGAEVRIVVPYLLEHETLSGRFCKRLLSQLERR